MSSVHLRTTSRLEALVPAVSGPSKRQQAGDAVVVAAEERGEHADHRGHVERVRLLHRLEISPVPGAIEERLEHREVLAREEGKLHARERLPPYPGRDALVEV